MRSQQYSYSSGHNLARSPYFLEEGIFASLALSICCRRPLIQYPPSMPTTMAITPMLLSSSWNKLSIAPSSRLAPQDHSSHPPLPGSRCFATLHLLFNSSTSVAIANQGLLMAQSPVALERFLT